MPKLNLVSHFEAALLFALFSSIVLGIVTKKSDKERLQYGLRCFAYFVGSVFVIGWLMYFGHR
jgi:ABC-type dipeptide/oligopeptide/nickel transport system permease component